VNAQLTAFVKVLILRENFNFFAKVSSLFGDFIKSRDYFDLQIESGAHPQFFLGGGGADPEAIYNLCLILKIMLWKSCCKYNIILFADTFLYMRI
jgi:hypothetical protein